MKLHNPNFTALFSTYLHMNMILLITITLLCFQPATFSATSTNETDRLALLKFKRSIVNDPHGILISWNDSIQFCNWHGITCGRRHQRVTTLELQGHDLRGTISAYIGNLTFLRTINLLNNSFYGEIPNEVGHLFRLQDLNLFTNKLGGEIPGSLTNCSELRTMDLSWNELVGTIPMGLGSLTKLLSLQVSRNNLTGGIPPSLGNLSLLDTFSVAENLLEGNIPESIGHMKSLSFFTVGDNKLNGTFPSSLYNISSINVFVISLNQFYGNLPSNIGFTLPNLEQFGLGSNQFFGPIPSSFCNASRLQKLDLSRNNFVGSVPTNLGNLQGLEWISLGFNNLGRDLNFITSLRNCSKLRLLQFPGNQFQCVLPNSIGNLTTELSALYFGQNQIYGTIPAVLENLINLNALGMEFNMFKGVIPAYFGKFLKMQGLYLTGNKLSGQIPHSLGNLTQLVELFLDQNSLKGSLPPSIGNCRDLLRLDVSQNYLNGVIPRQVFNLFSLSLLLNLSYNSFSGKLPVEVGNLKNINSLDFSKNNLSGEIPETIGNCLNLENLYLRGNSFEGIIPSSMASLKGLERLDVSQNNLSGLIPKGLEKLTFLIYLNISFNNIEGELPTKGVFSNFSAIFVMGNSKLCGGIPQLQLPTCLKVTNLRNSLSSRSKITIVCVVTCFLLVSSFLVFCWRKNSNKKSSSTVSKMNFLPTISYKMLHQATNGFSPNNLIGSGSFGSVYKGVLDQEEKYVAVKVLNLEKKGASKSFMAECNVLRNARHRNLIKILTCCSSINYNGDEFKALVFEFMTNGSLDMWLHPMTNSENQSKDLSILQRLNIAIDVASALNYLHNHCEKQIIHCDLKPSNVLIDDDMIAHVSDFGLAKLLSTSNDSSQKSTSTIGLRGSIGYAPPEYGMGGEASIEGDVYSYGVLVLEMFTGRMPTNDIFKDGLNLHNFVKMALPERLAQVVDPKLLPKDTVEMGATMTTMMAIEEEEEDKNVNEIELDEVNNIDDSRHIDADIQKCLLSILNIGILCSLESPKERMTMEEVTRELQMIKNTSVGVGINRGRPSKAQAN
ncbi:hypothetical protein SO802_010932 [Lithocarpus litseifolius]|uniref:non-specific serine/threonine protein kinase n=1 Tax=Lithocarpus litseifolius TaxID=425828 RepID=A0AAW2DJS0_9ROSI